MGDDKSFYIVSADMIRSGWKKKTPKMLPPASALTSTHKGKVHKPSPHDIPSLFLLVDDAGRIEPRNKTQLAQKQYKKFSRAVRAARNLGYISHTGASTRNELRAT